MDDAPAEADLGPAAALAALAAAAWPAGAAAADTACRGDAARASAENRAQVDAALYCLVNAYRLASGVPALNIDPRLGAAARARYHCRREQAAAVVVEDSH